MNMTYGRIKAEDITGAMKASSSAMTHAEKCSNDRGLVWNQTVSIIMERVSIDPATVEPTKESIQSVGQVLKETMSAHIQSSVTIPEYGTSTKGEKGWKIRNKSGEPQWFSWVETKVIWGYLGDVAKVLCYGLSGTLYPEKYKVASRCEILKACKIPETPLKAVERLTTALQGNLDKMETPVDVAFAANAVNNLMVNNYEPKSEAEALLKKLNIVLNGCSRAEKNNLQPMIAALLPHFA
ncbi:MAG: hypothetical protein WC148_03905 [Bacilli bacterium]